MRRAITRFSWKCHFDIYIPPKREKYGIEVVMLNDISTSHTINAIPFLWLSDKYKGDKEKQRKSLKEDEKVNRK